MVTPSPCLKIPSQRRLSGLPQPGSSCRPPNNSLMDVPTVERMRLEEASPSGRLRACHDVGERFRGRPPRGSCPRDWASAPEAPLGLLAGFYEGTPFLHPARLTRPPDRPSRSLAQPPSPSPSPFLLLVPPPAPPPRHRKSPISSLHALVGLIINLHLSSAIR